MYFYIQTKYENYEYWIVYGKFDVNCSCCSGRSRYFWKGSNLHILQSSIYYYMYVNVYRMTLCVICRREMVENWIKKSFDLDLISKRFEFNDCIKQRTIECVNRQRTFPLCGWTPHSVGVSLRDWETTDRNININIILPHSCITWVHYNTYSRITWDANDSADVLYLIFIF